MRKIIYYTVNGIAALAAMYFLLRMLINNNLLLGIMTKASALWLVPAAVAAVCVYFIKALRLYIVLMEQPISLSRFLRTYIKTTFVSLALPYKLGEVFRIICFGYETRIFSHGILAVLIDRFFDSIPLVILIVGYAVFLGESLSALSVILLLFVASCMFVFLMYPASSKYLNRFLIVKVSSLNGNKALNVLDRLDNVFDVVLFLVRGRALLLLLLSGVSWFFEFASVYCIAQLIGVAFGAHSFLYYLNSIFLGGGGNFTIEYLSLGATIFMFTASFHYFKSWLKRGFRNEFRNPNI